MKQLAFEFTIEVAGQFILLAIFTGVILLEMIYYIMGMIHFVYAAVRDDYERNIQSAYVFLFFSVWVIGTTMQIYKFCISYLCCQWFFKDEKAGLMEVFKVAFKHIGSLSLSTLICMFLDILMSGMKRIEGFFRYTCCFCISIMLKSCRKSLEKLVSSLTIVRIAHSGDNYCASMSEMGQQIAREPFYFLFVIWGADLVSSIIGFISFVGGLLVGFAILFNEKDIVNQGFAIVLFVILCITIASQVAELFVTNYRMVLYSIGTYFDLCSKYKKGVSVERYKITIIQLETAKEGCKLEIKDIS